MKKQSAWLNTSIARGVLAIGLGALAIGVQLAMAGQPSVIAGRAEAVAGEALHVDERYIRLDGIDAPEFSQTCLDRAGSRRAMGRLAARRLGEMVAGHEVSCRLSRGHSGQGVLVATCAANGEDLAGALIDEGLAWPISSTGGYAERARAAARTGAGVWPMTCRAPADWRADPGIFMGLRPTTD